MRLVGVIVYFRGRREYGEGVEEKEGENFNGGR